MEESIYNLIPQPVPVPEKPPMYRSKHNGACPPTFSTFGITNTSKPGYTNLAGQTDAAKEGHHVYKKAAATMGKDGNAVPPSQMLKKSTGGGGGPCADASAMSAPSGGACRPAYAGAPAWHTDRMATASGLAAVQRADADADRAGSR